jgi:hypothetical protein
MKHFTLLTASLLTLGASAQITDGNFEAGAGSGAWTEASTNFGTPFCTTAACAPGSPVFIPFNGLNFLWFGGAGGASATIPEEASVEQSANVPTGSDVTLSMWVKYAAYGSAGDYLRVLVDGTMIGEIVPGDSDLFSSDYTGVGYDLNAYAGASHTIRIESQQNSSTNIQNILVDQVEILADGASIGIFENEDLPGIQVYPSPASDVITMTFNALAGRALITITNVNGQQVSSQEITEVNQRTLTFDATTLENGIYLVTVQQGATTYTARVVVAH